MSVGRIRCVLPAVCRNAVEGLNLYTIIVSTHSGFAALRHACDLVDVAHGPLLPGGVALTTLHEGPVFQQHHTTSSTCHCKHVAVSVPWVEL